MIPKTIYIFGNSLLSFDNIPIKILKKLEKKFPEINFIVQDPNENLKPESKELFIIDTVINTDKVVLITDIDKIQQEKMYSLHDFDLGFNLKLLKKIGELDRVKIIGVPHDIEEGEALVKVSELIERYVMS